MMSILGILSDYFLFLVVSWHAPEFHGSGWIILTIFWRVIQYHLGKQVFWCSIKHKNKSHPTPFDDNFIEVNAKKTKISTQPYRVHLLIKFASSFFFTFKTLLVSHSNDTIMLAIFAIYWFFCLQPCFDGIIKL